MNVTETFPDILEHYFLQTDVVKFAQKDTEKQRFSNSLLRERIVFVLFASVMKSGTLRVRYKVHVKI